MHAALSVTPWQAALGAKLTVPTLAGEVELRIPAGSDSGKRMRLRYLGLWVFIQTPVIMAIVAGTVGC